MRGVRTVRGVAVALALVATASPLAAYAGNPDRTAVAGHADADVKTASAAQAASDWTTAIDAYRSAWMGHRKAVGWQSVAAATDAYNLSMVLTAAGRLDEATRVRRQAIVERQRAIGGGGSDLADLWRLEGQALESQKPDQSAVAWQTAFALFEQDPRRIDSATEAAAGVALTWSVRVRPEQGLAWAERAVAMSERGASPTMRTWALTTRGRLKSEAGDFDGGLVDLAQAVAARDPDDGNPLQQQALALDAQGRYDEAAGSLTIAIAAFEQRGADGRPGLAEALNTLGQVRTSQQLYPQAEALYRRGLEVAADDPFETSVINANLGWNLDRQGRYAEAEPLLRQAVIDIRAHEGRETRNYGFTLGNLAGDLQAQGRHAEALPLLKKGYESLARIIGPNHPAIGWTVNALAGSTAVVEGPNAAEPWFRQGLDLARRMPPGHPQATERAEDFSRILLKAGRPGDALEVLRPAGQAALSRVGSAGETVQSQHAFDRSRALFRLTVEAAWARSNPGAASS
jgi:tetratricopeptide (TPR) repeat protein